MTTKLFMAHVGHVHSAADGVCGFLGEYLHAVADIWLDMAPWLLLGLLVAFFCSLFLSERWMHRHLGGPGWYPIVKASVFGLPLPICSCGVLLVALALRKSGARKAPVCAFLASTPQSGTDALLVSWPLLGPMLTLLRFVGAVFAGLLTGALVRWFGVAQPPPVETEDLRPECSALCACHHHDPTHPHHAGEAHHHEYTSPRQRLRDAAAYAFVHLPGEIGPLLFVGVLIAAAFTVSWDSHWLCGLPLAAAYALAVIIGLPTYACSLAIVPIAAGLIAQGLTPGAAFLFMVCAPTTHISALLVMAKEFGWKTVVWFVIGVILSGLCMALLIDFPLADFIRVPGALGHHGEHSHMLGLFFLIPVAAVFILASLNVLTNRLRSGTACACGGCGHDSASHDHASHNHEHCAHAHCHDDHAHTQNPKQH